ncbi:FAD/NAD(P)-binding domain-containing protein [Testicularia cyperi]|uniref:FAD/NAD(P)-binding domain-containing protein n=1 Tax=Testicularia cyperi TaxID=1882483 RepID=A0A317XW09_9BASI|nr:FAD/NAD(P)-binding domain-containing protein [Testicularia cyperi]
MPSITTTTTAPTSTQYEAIIVGGGPSGIASAARLQLDLGLENIRIFERGTKFGGTWYFNRYPGAACDVPPRLYSFSFHQKRVWKHFFARQSEMEEYLQEVAARFGLEAKTEFGTEVYGATWDESRCHWLVKYRTLDGEHHATATARTLVNCSGALSVPRDCDVPGWQDFEGPLFHSARWDTSVDLTDKRVVVLGNGCSATQIVPSVAPQVKSVTQIVRAKHWYAPTPQDPMPGRVAKWLERNVPGFIQLQRGIIALLVDTSFIQAWNKEGKGARDRFARESIKYIRTVAPERYHHLLIPTAQELTPACKRRIFDDAYLPALNRDNVELTDDPAVRIEPHSVVLKSGRRLPADVVVLASGFKTADTNVQMRVVGRDGHELNDVWRKHGAPQAYRSAMCHNFPNFVMVWGANSVTGHFSAIWTIESTVRFMTTVFKPLFVASSSSSVAAGANPLERSRGRSVDVRKEAQQKEDVMIQEQMKSLVYTSGCKGWYTNDSGRVSTLYPGFQMTFAWRSNLPVASDLIYTGIPGRASASWSFVQQVASGLRLGDLPEYRPEYLARRSPVAKWIGDPIYNTAAWLGTKFLLVFVYLLDVGMMYRRTEQDYLRLRDRVLAASNAC